MLKEHNWHQLKDDTAQRLSLLAPYFCDGKIVDAKNTVAVLEAIIRSADRVNIEGNNQKQADFLAECLCKVDPEKISGLHMVQSSVPISTHLDLFGKGSLKSSISPTPDRRMVASRSLSSRARSSSGRFIPILSCSAAILSILRHEYR